MRKLKAIIYALLAAVFYAINVPISKMLLEHVGETTMAALLYLGAGVGISILSVFMKKDRKNSEKLSGNDLPYVIGMIVLDIAAPIFMMIGISRGTSANASLLGNFEIVATTIIALIVFKEAVTKRLWLAIGLITLSSVMLSFEGTDSFSFSYGSLFVLAATACWGLENNCTRKISSKDTYEIVILKGIFSGLGALIIAFIIHESFPEWKYIAIALILGFVAYGMSIFLYVRAQNVLGAAKTSAYYAVAPFAGAFLSFVFLKETLSWMYMLALIVMLIGSVVVVTDTLIRYHSHEHQHTFTHTHDGSTHEHTITHIHDHAHYVTDSKHGHHHSKQELEQEPGAVHIG
ncbi:MAG: EamA family transporter [Lachnospiraceae bacterium]|nr:EamA family transporter [Lachnospiraceae bacterium]